MPHCSDFRIGGIQVRVTGGNVSDVALAPPLDAFRVESNCPHVPDVAVQVHWSTTYTPSLGRSLFDSGSIWRLHENNRGLQFDFRSTNLGDQPYKKLFVDKQFRTATLQMNAKCFAAHACVALPLEYPLDELLIMHRLTQEPAIELHGVGIVGPNGASNLFIGHSGAGKSTTARLWTSLHPVKILSDDRIIVRESPARELQPGDDPRQIFMYGTPWHGEACFALPERALLQRIFILEHGSGNVLTRLSRSQAVAELFARSFVPFHRHEYVEHALSFLEQVADSIPCYRYDFEPDERAVERILNFRD